jgi:hypothetical protein
MDDSALNSPFGFDSRLFFLSKRCIKLQCEFGVITCFSVYMDTKDHVVCRDPLTYGSLDYQ